MTRTSRTCYCALRTESNVALAISLASVTTVAFFVVYKIQNVVTATVNFGSGYESTLISSKNKKRSEKLTETGTVVTNVDVSHNAVSANKRARNIGTIQVPRRAVC
jgi:hypothetical protein